MMHTRVTWWVVGMIMGSMVAQTADIGQLYMAPVMDAGMRLWRLLDTDGVSAGALDSLGPVLIDEALMFYYQLGGLVDQAYAQVSPVYDELSALLQALSKRIERLHEQSGDAEWHANPLFFSTAAIIEGCQRRLTKPTLYTAR